MIWEFLFCTYKKLNVITMLRTCGKYLYSALDSGANCYIEKTCQLRGLNAVFNRSLQKDVNKLNSQRTLAENERKNPLGAFSSFNWLFLKQFLPGCVAINECQGLIVFSSFHKILSFWNSNVFFFAKRVLMAFKSVCTVFVAN